MPEADEGITQCVWLTLDSQNDFNAINYWMKPIQALYLTPETMDGRFVSDWVRARENSWGDFMLQVVSQKKIPSGFPLHVAANGFLPDRFFLTDRVRWPIAPP